MIIILHGEQKYIPVSTVTVAKEGNGKTHPFHCVYCGNTTNILGGVVTQIYPILEPSEQITVITTCRSCKEKYTFQDTTEPPSMVVDIQLKRTERLQPFYCYLGGGETKDVNKILEYDLKRLYSCVDHTYVQLPYTCKCTNPMCPVSYRFF